MFVIVQALNPGTLGPEASDLTTRLIFLWCKSSLIQLLSYVLLTEQLADFSHRSRHNSKNIPKKATLGVKKDFFDP